MNVEQINFQDVLAYFACFYWWIIPTSILAAVALNLSRGVIRLKKKFMAHIKDPNAHKGE